MYVVINVLLDGLLLFVIVSIMTMKLSSKVNIMKEDYPPELEVLVKYTYSEKEIYKFSEYPIKVVRNSEKCNVPINERADENGNYFSEREKFEIDYDKELSAFRVNSLRKNKVVDMQCDEEERKQVAESYFKEKCIIYVLEDITVEMNKVERR